MNIKQIKEEVRLLKLSNPNMSAYEILKKQKFILGCIPTELSDELPKGCYFKEGFLRTVLVRDGLSAVKAKIVYTHELGHSRLHPEINTFLLHLYDPVFVTRIENEADTFAAEFLLDDDVFIKHAGKSIYEIASIEEVTVELVELKYKNLDKSKFYDTYDYALDF